MATKADFTPDEWAQIRRSPIVARDPSRPVGVVIANASREGGFLSIGGTRVSGEEEAALRDIAAALGVQAT